MKTQKITIYTVPHNGRTQAQFLPFPLPDGQRGEWRVEHETKKAGAALTVVSMRNAIFMGLKPAKLMLTHDTVVHTLREGDKGVWMTSAPQEVEQATRQLAGLRGHVLVGGLGLGLAAVLLLRNRKVTRVTVCEKSAEVCALVGPFIAGSKWSLLNVDLFAHLQECELKGWRYDSAFYDIWCPTGELAYGEFIQPLRRASIGVVPQDKIECWNEKEMTGQVAFCIQSQLMMRRQGTEMGGLLTAPEEQFVRVARKRVCDGKVSLRQDWAYLNWVRRTQPTDERAQEGAQEFIAALSDMERYDHQWKEWEP